MTLASSTSKYIHKYNPRDRSISTTCGLLVLLYFGISDTLQLAAKTFMETAVTNNKSNAKYGYDIINWFENLSENAGKVQTQTLRRILELNHGVQYLQKWLGDINIQEMDACSLESIFTSMVPLASHADFEPFIQRIADGDTGPLLTQQPMATLSLR